MVNHSDYIHEFQISLYILDALQPSAMVNLGIPNFSHTIIRYGLRWYQALYTHRLHTITAHTVQLHLPYTLNGGLELVSMDTFLPLGDY